MAARTGIGIDTGGTYTDAVIFDFESKTVLGTSKALTTKNDLSIGILAALDRLPVELIRSAEVVSLSTTLATNACVEDKGGRAKLIFFGGNESVIRELGGKYGLPPAEEIYIQECRTSFSTGEIESEPDWGLFGENIQNMFDGLDGAGIIEMNSMKNSAVIEKKAKELFQRVHGIPVVCGHELFNELNCLQRGSGTLLNARLFPVIQEFLDAIKTAMRQRRINAPVVIVRSDGSLMSEAFARVRPVETLLCGPAASVMGGAWLTGDINSVIIDMGGTTTDIALVKEGVPVKAVNGVSIGKWKTFVNGLYIRTVGLGGDSAIHYNDEGLILEEYRVVPLCVAAAEHPSVIANLKKLVENSCRHTRFLYEHFILVRDISDSARHTDEEKRFCAALKDGPLILRDAAAAIGRDIYNLDVSRLLREGTVLLCGLTPTDIMHVKGDFSVYPAEASVLGAQFAASNLGVTVEELCDRVYTEIKRKLYINIVKALLEIKDPYYMRNGVNEDVERFINQSFDLASAGRGLLSMRFHTEFTLMGIGAPIHIFLEDVADMLGTKAVIPAHFAVANALGALAGSVYATCEVDIKPNCSAGGITGYTVYGNTKTSVFETLEEAELFAVKEAEQGAYEEAVKRGAQGEITVDCTLEKNEAGARDTIVYLGTRAAARAVGAIGFAGDAAVTR